jgi:NodT family efflux transporter outer membrane factor (OMF) lipoprotein
MIRSLLLLGVATLSLSACATAPVYQRDPDAAINRPAVTADFLNGQNAAFAANAVPGDWWKLYDDARLNGLIEDALKANTDLRIAAAHIERARAGLELTEDAGKIQTEVGGAVEYGKPSAEEFLLIGEKIPSDFLYGVSGKISYQLDLAGQVKSASDASRADVAASQAAYDAVRITVVADTTRAWLDACATAHQVVIVKQALALQSESTAMTKRLVAAGRGGTTDVTRSTGMEAQTRAALPALLGAHDAALNRLALLTGRAPAELPGDIGACAALPQLTQPIPIGDGAALLQRRPDIRAREAELSAATSRAGIAHASLYPHIALGASLGSGGLVSRAFNQDTMKYSLGPLISWEFPNRGRAEANIAAAHADIDAAQARFDGVVLGALRETETALNGYARDLDQRAELAKARDQAMMALSETQRLQKAGKIGAIPVLEARRMVVTADQAVAALDAKLAGDQVQVFLALGGGWETVKP